MYQETVRITVLFCLKNLNTASASRQYIFFNGLEEVTSATYVCVYICVYVCVYLHTYVRTYVSAVHARCWNKSNPPIWSPAVSSRRCPHVSQFIQTVAAI